MHLVFTQNTIWLMGGGKFVIQIDAEKHVTIHWYIGHNYIHVYNFLHMKFTHATCTHTICTTTVEVKKCLMKCGVEDKVPRNLASDGK